MKMNHQNVRMSILKSRQKLEYRINHSLEIWNGTCDVIVLNTFERQVNDIA